MSTLARRLKYYGIGFGIGLIIVFFFFGNRGCNWGPEARVKSIIADRVLIVNEADHSELKKKGITSEEMIKMIEDSDIDFGESKKDDDLKVYKFHHNESDYVVSLPYESYIAELSFLRKDAFNFHNSKQGKGKILHFPKDKDFIYVPDNDALNCQMKEMGFKDNNGLYEQIKSSGTIDFNKTNFDARPKATHVICFRDKKNRNVEATTIWMKEKIEVVSFVIDSIVPCK